VIMQVGPDKAMDMARALGVKSTLHPFPSAVLGTNDVHPIDMATAYGTFANQGVHTWYSAKSTLVIAGAQIL